MLIDYRIALIGVLSALVVWSTSKILVRLGFSPWWAAVSFITPLNVISLVVLALIEWPIERKE